MQIKVENLSHVYSKNSKTLAVKALSNVSLSINEGEFFGVIGHTGSGKTTFIQHLNGLIKVGKESGKITIGEFDLTDKKCDFKALRSRVGMVFQYPEYQLFAETVFDDVAFGVKNFMPKSTPEQTEQLVREALELVGLDYQKYKGKSPFELSGGQKRRVAIAGVLVTKPEVLVLDEPVAGLDPVGKKDFISLLHDIHKKFVKTIIIVSHDMNLISEHCDRVAVFESGFLRSVSTPKEFFSDFEKVESLSLELPTTAYLKKALLQCGKGEDFDLTIDKFVEQVTASKGVE